MMKNVLRLISHHPLFSTSGHLSYWEARQGPAFLWLCPQAITKGKADRPIFPIITDDD
jgi:hypothetical protein